MSIRGRSSFETGLCDETSCPSRVLIQEQQAVEFFLANERPPLAHTSPGLGFFFEENLLPVAVPA